MSLNPRIVISWDEFKLDCERLAKLVVNEKMEKAAFLAIANGGLFVAGMLGRILQNDDIAILGAKRKAIIGGGSEGFDVDITSSFLCRYFVDRANYEILLVDDIYDSGTTLKVIHQHLVGKLFFKQKQLRIMYAAPYYKASQYCRSTKELSAYLISPMKIDFWYWVKFPWEPRDGTEAYSKSNRHVV
jgi:hypoxanthine phosphoribosyltransferase